MFANDTIIKRAKFKISPISMKYIYNLKTSANMMHNNKSLNFKYTKLTLILMLTPYVYSKLLSSKVKDCEMY